MRQGHQYVIAQEFMRHPIKSRSVFLLQGLQAPPPITNFAADVIRACTGQRDLGPRSVKRAPCNLCARLVWR